MTNRNFYEDEPLDTTAAARTVNGVVVASPPALESSFKSARESLFSAYSASVDYVNSGYTKYYNTEQKVTTTVSELHDKSEDLMPNAVYVFIAALSGNIMARQRGIMAKAVFPVVLGLGSFKYFLPKTFSSTMAFVWRLEQQKVPEIAKQQEQLVTKLGELVGKLEKTGEASREKVSGGLEKAREVVSKYTGLNFEDATKK